MVEPGTMLLGGVVALSTNVLDGVLAERADKYLVAPLLDLCLNHDTAKSLQAACQEAVSVLFDEFRSYGDYRNLSHEQQMKLKEIDVWVWDKTVEHIFPTATTARYFLRRTTWRGCSWPSLTW